MNKHSHKSGENGALSVKSATDLSTLDESSLREGRITHKLNIDEAI